MTELEKVQHQLNNALAELMKVNLNENELLYDYIFEAHRLVKKLTIPDVVGRSEQLKCDNCKCTPTVIHNTPSGRFCEACRPVTL